MSDREILRQLTSALNYLHKANIVHRDIKPKNILISITQKYPNIKLADFGISKILKREKFDFTNTNKKIPKGTTGYMPPEIYESDRFDFKVDIFALGCIFGSTLSGGKHPFGKERDRIYQIKERNGIILTINHLKKVYRNDYVFQLIKSMVRHEPIKRPKAGKILQNRFFSIDPVIIIINLFCIDP